MTSRPTYARTFGLTQREVDDFLVRACYAADSRKDLLVYFIRAADGAIKIGFTRNLQQRLAALNSAHAYPLRVLGTLAGGKTTEQELHRRFRVSRIQGEWFAPHPDLLAFIDHVFGVVLDA